MDTRPLFCPYKDCTNNQQERSGDIIFYRKHGSYRRRDGSRVQRFRCSGCGRSFSLPRFSMDYWTQTKVDYRPLMPLLDLRRGIRAAGRQLGCSPKTIMNRLSRLTLALEAAPQDPLAAYRLHTCLEPSGNDGSKTRERNGTLQR